MTSDNGCRYWAMVTNSKHSDEQQPGVLVPGVATPPQYTITYTSIPQPGLNNRTSPVYTAKVVGGASVHNGMFFNRGSKGDYDGWEKLGNPGWAWDDLLPYFQKVVRNVAIFLLDADICAPLIRAKTSHLLQK